MEKYLKRFFLFILIFSKKPLVYRYIFNKKKSFSDVDVYSDEDTFFQIVENQKSIIRLGDSDLAYIRDNFFSNDSHKKEFVKIYKVLLKNENEHIIVGIPNLFIRNYSSIFIARNNFNFKNWINLLPILFYHLNYKTKYGSSFVFRQINFYPNFNYLKSCNLFLDYLDKIDKNILFISDKNYFSEKINKKILFYEMQEWKESDLHLHLTTIMNSYEQKKIIILIRVKILSRILGYSLIQNGYRVIDVGQLI